jgi:hypothetical protein
MRRNSKYLMAAILYVTVPILALGGCTVNPIRYSRPTTVERAVLFAYPWCNDQPSGIAVSSSGRIFISFPRWNGNPSNSVAEVLTDGSLRPYPDSEWNHWGGAEESRPNAHFISAQGLYIDSNGTLWVLDSAAVNLKSVSPTGAKLVGIDLDTNRVSKVIPFDADIVQQNSYLRHVCVDEWSNLAYISDAGTGAILVTDLQSGLSRRVLAENPTTKAEPDSPGKQDRQELRYENGEPVMIHVDGIALDKDSKFLYYHALSARTLYRIETRYVNDPLLSPEELGAHVERLADTGQVDGMVMDSYYNLFLTLPYENAVKRYRVYDGSLVTLAQDEHISWPDSICLSPDRNLYFTASQFNRLPYFNKGKDERKVPYMVFMVSKSYPLAP